MLELPKKRINCNYICLSIQNIWGGGVLKQKKDFLAILHFSATYCAINYPMMGITRVAGCFTPLKEAVPRFKY